VGRDPTGKAVVAGLAAHAQLGNVDPLRIAIGSVDPSEGAALRDQVMMVLTHGGADVAAIAASLDAAAPN